MGARNNRVVSRGKSSTGGFTIIELLITVIVIGVLAAAGLAKYQNFAEQARRKTCLFQLQTIENALATWEAQNGAFSPLTKAGWGYSTRTGRLVGTDLSGTPSHDYTGDLGGEGPGDGGRNAAPGVLPNAPINAVGAQPLFRNAPAGGTAFGGPLNTVIRDDKVWACPSALSFHYGGEIQNLSDVNDVGMRPNLTISLGSANIVGITGRYNTLVVGPGPDISNEPYDNSNLPLNWVTPKAAATGEPAPQTPFSITVCGCYGTYGPSSDDRPGNEPVTGNGGGAGGPVGANGSALNRHSARW